jgi:serine/threonine-protein kinase
METTIWQGLQTITFGREKKPSEHPPDELIRYYRDLTGQDRLAWTEHLHLERRLGAGGQGVVYLSQRRGADGFTLPVALKIFSPEHFPDEKSYLAAMFRIGQVGCRVAQIQHDNLIDVQNFIERYRIRIMEMEWVDGFDLQRLLSNKMLARVESRVSSRRWNHLNNVVVTKGPAHPRLKPAIAVAIVRECLGGLSALHREEIVHGDIKPSNIMLKKTGHAKIIDIGAAVDLNNMPEALPCTLAYAAPETLDHKELTPKSDLASLGYVLIEMLSGRPLFAGAQDLKELLEAKRVLPHRLHELVPPEVADSSLLMEICRRLTAPDPNRRFKTAADADTDKGGLAEFERSLIFGNLFSEADHDIQDWLEELDGNEDW